MCCPALRTYMCESNPLFNILPAHCKPLLVFPFKEKIQSPYGMLEKCYGDWFVFGYRVSCYWSINTVWLEVSQANDTLETHCSCVQVNPISFPLNSSCHNLVLFSANRKQIKWNILECLSDIMLTVFSSGFLQSLDHRTKNWSARYSESLYW